MGFINREANIQGIAINNWTYEFLIYIVFFYYLALIATFGDVNAAVERLLQNRTMI